MDLKQQKLKMWKEKLTELEKQLRSLMLQKGEAAKAGDLRENSAYQLAIEEIDTTRASINDVKRIIINLENHTSPKKTRGKGD